MIWARFSDTGPGLLAVFELTMNSFVYQSILESYEAIFPTTKTWLKLGHAPVPCTSANLQRND